MCYIWERSAAVLKRSLLYFYCNFPLQVIAIVTDSLTDLDIFKDLQEACSYRKVPVYILLDQSCAPAFLKMCRNVGVRLDDLRVCGWFSKAGCGSVCIVPTEDGTKWKYILLTLTGQVLSNVLPQHSLSSSSQQMRVRTLTGTNYYMRSGARITGEVHERFMLIDGNRVATGSYRYVCKLTHSKTEIWVVSYEGKGEKIIFQTAGVYSYFSLFWTCCVWKLEPLHWESCLFLNVIPGQVQLDWWQTKQQQPNWAFWSDNREIWWGVSNSLCPVSTYKHPRTKQRQKQWHIWASPHQKLRRLLSSPGQRNAIRAFVFDQHPQPQAPNHDHPASMWTLCSGPLCDRRSAWNIQLRGGLGGAAACAGRDPGW